MALPRFIVNDQSIKNSQGFCLENAAGRFDGTKKAYGAAIVPETDTQASLMYCDTEVMRAAGTAEVFAQYATTGEGRDTLGFQQCFTALPIWSKFIAALYSNK